MAVPGTTPATRRVPSWLLLAVVCVGQFMVVLDVTGTEGTAILVS